VNHILERFIDAAPWNRLDEWCGISVELTEEGAEPNWVCAFFGEDQADDFKLMIVRGSDPAEKYLQYRTGEWVPEFGLDFGTSNSIRVGISDDQITSYESLQPGLPPAELRLDEKQLMFEVMDAVTSLISAMDTEKVPILGESEDVCYHLWKVAKTWRADVREFPEESMIQYPAIPVNPDRIKRILAAGLLVDGVWEASPFYLPVTRFQGDQEVYVQCAGVAERGMGLLGLVTLEAHADPEVELMEAIVGSIEKQKRIPQFLVVKEDRIADRLLPLIQPLGIQLRHRKRLRELDQVREEMIEEFPDDTTDADSDET
jgi:hypothetical protein